jgi:hypothetical protein
MALVNCLSVEIYIECIELAVLHMKREFKRTLIIPGFQVRGGALKRIAPSRGRHEIFGVFRVKNHDFTPKNHIVTLAVWLW